MAIKLNFEKSENINIEIDKIVNSLDLDVSKYKKEEIEIIDQKNNILKLNKTIHITKYQIPITSTLQCIKNIENGVIYIKSLNNENDNLSVDAKFRLLPLTNSETRVASKINVSLETKFSKIIEKLIEKTVSKMVEKELEKALKKI